MREMVSSFVVTLFLLALSLFCGAIICTHLLGRGEGLPRRTAASSHYHDEIRQNFFDIETSVFTLFQIATLDNWIQIAKPVIMLDPKYSIPFIIFICFCSWTMISVLTAVASESMIMATAQRDEAELQEQQERRKDFLLFLRDKFHEGDVDGNGVLDKQEFRNLVSGEEVLAYMVDMGANSLNQDYLFNCWDMLDVNGDGVLVMDEFVNGLAAFSDELSTKHIVHVDNLVKYIGQRSEARVDALRTCVGDMKRENDQVLSFLRMQDRMHEQQTASFWLWQQWALEENPDCLPEQVLQYIRPPKPSKGVGYPASGLDQDECFESMPNSASSE